MNAPTDPSDEPTNLRNPALAAFLTWLFPGLGHWYQGRYFKALVFASSVIGLYLVGMWIGKSQVVYWTWVNPLKDSENFRLSFVFQSFVGGLSMPGLFQGLLSYFGKPPILGGWMAAPSQDLVNGLHPRIGRLVEIGTVYTAVAGLLNLLAMMDAYGGPIRYRIEEESSEPAAETMPGASE
ncbi:MAG: hypothetical protein NT172_19335 [Planctomycetota bacterium]|nr:hypothetical protein [Planctomycetota bacterium]